MKNRVSIFMVMLFVIIQSITIRSKADVASPILVLATDYKFGSYTSEILKTEGFNEFQVRPLQDPKVTLAYLRTFDVVVLTENALTVKQGEMFLSYVKDGGNLIAFRPDKKLSLLFGIAAMEGTGQEGYLLTNVQTEIGKGITSETLQFHGEADHYEVTTGKRVATFYKDATSATVYPAIVENNYGKGLAMAFLYNLPESVVLTRQGNYRYAGEETDGITGIRPLDMFTRGWVDASKNTLNQADEQMRLLSHGIEKMNRRTKPLPRFWYFPDTLKCLVALNNDGEDSKEEEFNEQFENVNSKGARMTLYIKETELISKKWTDIWANKGFEISGHPDDTRQATHPDWKTMDSVYKNLINRLDRQYGVPGMQTVTNHWFVWCGKNEDGSREFAAQARIEEKNGVRLDCNYAHYDNISNQGHYLGPFGTNQGNYTGSGLIMKFADSQGRGINVYQQLNNVYDQQYMEHKDQDGYYDCFRGLMDRSLNNEVYSFVCVRAHNNEYFFSKIPLMKMLDYANAKGVPVWTERELLEFLEMKDQATFTNIHWSNNQLDFTIKSSLTHSRGLTCLLPYQYTGKQINSISGNGVTQSYSVRSIKGFTYAMVTFKAGSDYSVEVKYDR